MRNKRLICILLFLTLASTILNVITLTKINKVLTKNYTVYAQAPQIEPSTELQVDLAIPKITYTDLGVPTNVNTSFKTWMDYRTVTNTGSAQYKFIKNYGWSDDNGFMRASGERDLGIPEDYYLIALGSYYGTTIGTKYRITTDTGNVFYGVLADCKANVHTNTTNQYASNNDVVEFIVDVKKLNSSVKRMGSANVYTPLSGNISKIEKIDFIE